MNDRAPHLSLLATAGLAVAVLFTSAGCPGGDGGNDAGTDAGPVVPDPEIISPNESGWWRDDVFYEVFVRSFYDADADGRGDLAGLTQKLDYLNDGDPETDTDLGVDGVWLMPIFTSPSYHGYDIVNYLEIDAEYGDLQDFDALIEAAHARGLKVILDLVINHTSSQHPWFVSAREGPESEHRDYYVWTDVRPAGDGWKRPWDNQDVWHHANGSFYYGVYNGGMPDLNWRNPAVEAEFVAIMKHWLSRGVDGFRVDAVRYLVETTVSESNKLSTDEDPVLADHALTHEVIQRLRYAIHQDHPGALLLAEAWTSTTGVGPYYGEGNEFQLAFNFELSDAIRASVNSGTRNAIHQANFLSGQNFPDRGFEAPFLSNHDQPRVMRTLAGGAVPSWAEARAAAALLMAHPGTPFLYYGEEIGMMGGTASFQRDEDKRTPLVWDATLPHGGFTTGEATWFAGSGSTGDATEPEGIDLASQQSDPSSLWSLYRELIALRKGSAALTGGDTARPAVTGGGNSPFAVLRTAPSGERMLFVVNLGATATGAFTLGTTGSVTPVLTEGTFTAPTEEGGVLSFQDLPPHAFAFFQLD